MLNGMDILVRDGEAKGFLSERLATHRKCQSEVSGQMQMHINIKAKLPYQILTGM
jgi:hypothetical protein